MDTRRADLTRYSDALSRNARTWRWVFASSLMPTGWFHAVGNRHYPVVKVLPDAWGVDMSGQGRPVRFGSTMWLEPHPGVKSPGGILHTSLNVYWSGESASKLDNIATLVQWAQADMATRRLLFVDLAPAVDARRGMRCAVDRYWRYTPDRATLSLIGEGL